MAISEVQRCYFQQLFKFPPFCRCCRNLLVKLGYWLQQLDLGLSLLNCVPAILKSLVMRAQSLVDELKPVRWLEHVLADELVDVPHLLHSNRMIKYLQCSFRLNAENISQSFRISSKRI